MADLLWGIGILVSGIVLYYESLSFPGMNSYVRGVLAVLIVCGVLQIGNSIYRYKLTGTFTWAAFDKNKSSKVLVVVVLTLLYATALPFLGYVVSSALFALLGMKYLAVKNNYVLILVTAGAIALSYFTFGILLSVPLPKGILAF